MSLPLPVLVTLSLPAITLPVTIVFLAAAPTAYGPAVAGVLVGAVCLAMVISVLKKIIMVKQGELCFAQFFENGATHVLTAGVQLVASFGTTTKSFGVKEDRMNFGMNPGAHTP